MKHLIFAVLLLAACSKPNITTYETKEVFYKLQEVDKDGKTIDSPIRSTSVTISSKNEDDDDDDDDHDHNPVPIKLETFVVVRLNSNTIKVYWEATNEDGVSHYNILKSFDSKVWNKVIKIGKGSGKYEYIDKF